MTNKLKAISFAIVLFTSLSTQAQEQHTTYILPDNTILPENKLDSLTQAWGGKERVLLSHNADDDAKHIVHLVRATDEFLKQMADDREQRIKTMKAMIDHPAPSWTASDLNGTDCSLSSLKGKVVVINFWFTSCAPCIQEMPHLNNLVASYKNKDVVFIAFSFNDPANIQSFLKKQPYNYRHVASSKDINSLYHIQSWPTSFVIDRNGIVKYAGLYDPNIESLLSTAIDHAL
ncbi:MAG: TlpA family protein disulfide reductase [Bacteroidetes bacterium]|nr:TlpA family protein disulfide reductase [Bacteroidota bacterium]